MPKFLLISVILITLALIFYSLGVWSEHISRYLKMPHVVAFWIGFTFDVSGTLAMHYISDKPFNLLNLHTLTGQIALWLMFIHAVWATVVLRRGKEKDLMSFHRYSIIVWLIWLIPYFGGMYISMKT